MRDPLPGMAWSRDRLIRRVAYATWMGSADWLAWRQAWHDAWSARHGGEPVCAACAQAWSLHHGDLHHRCYDRLGHEQFDDVTPLCRACHDQLHRILESSPSWRRMPRSQATDGIVALLRRAHRGQER